MSLSTSAPNAIADRPSLWRNRTFLLLWSGQIISTVGSRMSGTALPLLVLATTRSASKAGLVGAVGSLPLLLVPLVDRWNRRRIMIVSELLAGLALASVPVVAWFTSLSIAQLAVVAFVQSVGFVFFGLAEHAALPVIVPASQLSAAVAQNEAKGRGAALAGPPLAGLLFGISRTLPFLADALSYLVSTVGLLFIRGDLQADRTEPAGPLWREAKEGLDWVWQNRLVRTTMALIAISNMAFQALVLLLIVLAQQGGVPPQEVGIMLGIYAGGGLAGALTAGRLLPHIAPKTVLIGAFWLWAGLLSLFIFTTDPLLMGLIGGASAFIGPLWNVVIFTHIATLVPNQLLGRVTSAAMTIANGVIPLASLTAGYLITAIGTIPSAATLAAVMLITAVAATLSRPIREADL